MFFGFVIISRTRLTFLLTCRVQNSGNGKATKKKVAKKVLIFCSLLQLKVVMVEMVCNSNERLQISAKLQNNKISLKEF
jgi:hypothetical protein